MKTDEDGKTVVIDPSKAKDTKYKWVPFGAGRHRCIGFEFAQIQIRAVWSTILRHYEISIPSGKVIYILSGWNSSSPKWLTYSAATIIHDNKDPSLLFSTVSHIMRCMTYTFLSGPPCQLQDDDPHAPGCSLYVQEASSSHRLMPRSLRVGDNESLLSSNPSISKNCASASLQCRRGGALDIIIIDHHEGSAPSAP